MHLLPMFMLPPRESSLARGWITLSELMVIGLDPVKRAESAMVMEDEN